MSADEMPGADEAREVEVVARWLCKRADANPDQWVPVTKVRQWEFFRESATELLAALAPIRAAERQEAAREALLAAAEHYEREQRELARRTGTLQMWESACRWLRDRADGVTGRSGTC